MIVRCASARRAHRRGWHVAELGDALQEARRRRDVSLEEAERATRIRRIFLWALEQERYDLLPARVFAQGFLLLYCRYLGLDPKPLLPLLPQEAAPIMPPPLPRRRRLSALAWALSLVLFLIAGGAALYRYQQLATAATPEDRGAPERSSDTPLPVSPSTRGGSPAVVTPSTTSIATVTMPTSTPAATATPVPLTPLSGLVGQSRQQAVQALDRIGLRAVVQEQWSRQVAEGVVMAQQPEAGARLRPGDPVTLLVSKGPQGILVPSAVGLQEAAARRLIREAGLPDAPYANYQGRADLSESVLGQVCVGCVLSTTPQEGVEAAPGTLIYLAVRKE